MNRIDTQQAGGFPLETDTLDFMQKSFTALQALVSLGGDHYILSGCTVQSGNVSDGWVVINGELMPFKGGLLQSKVIIKENLGSRTFENGVNKVVFYERFAQFGSGDSSVPFSDLVNIKDLKTFRNLPHLASNEIQLDSELHLATSKALKTVYDALKNQFPQGGIIIWSGLIPNIPTGWALCDGIAGRPDLRNRFVLGSGGRYAHQQTGGAETHTLSINEMPAHDHYYNTSQGGIDFGSGSSRNSNTNHYGSSTGQTGGNMAHNNMPPFYALAYIIKL